MDLIKLEFIFRTVVLTWLCMNIEYWGLEAKNLLQKKSKLGPRMAYGLLTQTPQGKK